MMLRRQRATGFTLVEVIVAVLLLSSIALGLTTTLVGAQRARAISERWMQATQFAAQGIEQARAGQMPTQEQLPGGFTRNGSVALWNGHPGLYRLEVVVSWDDGEPRALQLVTLARR